MSTIADNIGLVSERIRAAAHAVQRDENSIHLLAVSKTKPAQLTDLPLSWHFIGPIQSNKTRAIAENFAWVHSVDRLKIAQRLSEQRPADLPPLNICIQVNVSGEASKSGCTPADLPALAEAISALPRLKLRGLMAIPEPTEDCAAQSAAFATVRTLQEHLNLPLDTLSMGMSHDLEAAIAQGATWVRIGTALFGARDYGQP